MVAAVLSAVFASATAATAETGGAKSTAPLFPA